jgi:hypothetical protein
MSKNRPKPDTKPDPKPSADGFPHYCKTDVGILGPYPNPDGQVKVGDSCFGTQNGQRYDGVAVMSKDDNGSGSMLRCLYRNKDYAKLPGCAPRNQHSPLFHLRSRMR